MHWQVLVGPEAIIHRRGKVVENTQFDTWVVIQGERWIERSGDELNLGDTIYVVGSGCKYWVFILTKNRITN